MTLGLVDLFCLADSQPPAHPRNHDFCVDTAAGGRSTVGVASETWHLEVLRLAWRHRHSRPGSLGRDCGVVHEFLAWLFRGWPGPGGHTRVDGDFRLRRAGSSRRE